MSINFILMTMTKMNIPPAMMYSLFIIFFSSKAIGLGARFVLWLVRYFSDKCFILFFINNQNAFWRSGRRQQAFVFHSCNYSALHSRLHQSHSYINIFTFQFFYLSVQF